MRRDCYFKLSEKKMRFTIRNNSHVHSRERYSRTSPPLHPRGYGTELNLDRDCASSRNNTSARQITGAASGNSFRSSKNDANTMIHRPSQTLFIDCYRYTKEDCTVAIKNSSCDKGMKARQIFEPVLWKSIVVVPHQ